MWAPDCVYKKGLYYFYFPQPSGTEWNKTWKANPSCIAVDKLYFNSNGTIQKVIQIEKKIINQYYNKV